MRSRARGRDAPVRVAVPDRAAPGRGGAGVASRAAPVAVVAAGHRESARAGAQILARGGNAVDAACAAAMAAGVAESPLTGPGAGGFLTARDPAGAATVLDFFVAVPGTGPGGRTLDPDDLHSFTVPFGDAEQEFHIGPASVAVPGMLHGLAEANRRLGRLGLGEVAEPAIRLAREGVIVTPPVAYLHEILWSMLTHTPECAAIFAPEGRMLSAGERLRIPELGEVLAAAVRDGPSVLDDALTGALGRAGGLLTRQDVDGYAATWRTPLEVAHGATAFITNPPPAAGGVLIAAALLALQGGGPRDEPGHYRAVIRAGLDAVALRDEGFVASLNEPGVAARLLARVPSRKPTGTTHVSVIDGDGGMASLSSSCGSGGGVVLPGTGVLLNNMLGEQDLNPAGFGRMAPGGRMPSMMAPSLLVRDGAPVAAIGSAGSNRLRSAILQTVVSLVDDRMGVAAAVARPRVHPEAGVVDVEAGVPEEAVAALIADGHRVTRWGAASLYFGGVAVAGRDASGLTGAGDPRRGGAAAGVTASGEVVDL